MADTKVTPKKSKPTVATKKAAIPSVVAKPAVSKPTVKKESGLTVPLFDAVGASKGTASVSKEMFSIPVNKELLQQYVHVYMTNQRQGTASTKTRGEIVGSTRKIYRQKGTGRARHGARNAPIFVGGGIVFGPRPRNYSLKMSKKQKTLAFFSALSLVYKNGSVAALTDESLDIAPKTKVFSSLLKNAKLDSKKLVLVLSEGSKDNLVRAARNIERLEIREAKTLNTYDVLNSNTLLFTKDALQTLEKHYLKS